MQRKLNEQFINQYSKQFSDKITSTFFTNRESISGKEILTVTPSKQVNFFILKALFQTWQEEMKQLESPYFDYRQPEVRRAMVDFMNTLSQHITVQKAAFRELLHSAVANTLVLTTDPAAYLASELQQKDIAQVTEKIVRPMIKYLKVHKNEINAFFEEQLNAPYDEVMLALPGYFDDLDLADALEAELETLSGIEPVVYADLWPAEPEAVVESEEFQPDLDELEEEPSEPEDDFEEPKEEAEPEAYQEEEDYREEDEADTEPEEEAPELPEEEIPYETSSREEEVEDTTEVTAEETYEADEQEELEEEREPEPEEEPVLDDELVEAAEEDAEKLDFTSESDASVNERYSEERITLHERFEKQEEAPTTLADKLQQHKVESIMDAISVNHRYMFTKELFDGDRDAFTAAIAAVEECDSFDEAVELLVQEHAKARDWDMNSEEVKELLKVVFRKFR